MKDVGLVLVGLELVLVIFLGIWNTIHERKIEQLQRELNSVIINQAILAQGQLEILDKLDIGPEMPIPQVPGNIPPGEIKN